MRWWFSHFQLTISSLSVSQSTISLSVSQSLLILQKGLPIGQHISLKFEEEDEESGKTKVRL